LSSEAVRQGLISFLPNLRAFAIALCGDADRADDLVQDTMLKAWNSLDTFQEGTNLRAWLFTILRNTYFSDCRRRRREVPDDDGEYVAQLCVPPSQHGAVDAQDMLKALARLTDDQREALILVGAEGFAYEEAAEICNCAVGTIKSRVNRARNRLSELLGIEAAQDFGPEPMTEAVLLRVSGSKAG
jgi:RNA polymerase sigma-70 factor (ECF subfamily)